MAAQLLKIALALQSPNLGSQHASSIYQPNDHEQASQALKIVVAYIC